jgi:hypothetical protein
MMDMSKRPLGIVVKGRGTMNIAARAEGVAAIGMANIGDPST